MRSDEEIAKAVEGILRAKSDRNLQDARAGGAGGLAGVGDGPDDFRDRAGDSGNGRDGVGGLRGAAGGFLEGLCEEIADRLFESLDTQVPLEAVVRLQCRCETRPHCSGLAETEIHVRETIEKPCYVESVPVGLRMRVTGRIVVYRSTTA